MSDEIRNIFDRIAPIYDQLNDWLSLGQHRIWKEMTVKWSEAKAGDTCLDLCCGSGDLAFRLARRVGKSGQVYGVDF
ncbi:bifunctional demethylmenaquinone methyltransferase/2-methoxy-6-polyprenyl-1,4-benzoquinol methylase, partial [Fischerella thermalis CCMEE 5273]